MTEEPNDTVFSSKVNIAGYTDKDGTITIKQNGKVLIDSEAKATNEVFEVSIKLNQIKVEMIYKYIKQLMMVRQL